MRACATLSGPAAPPELPRGKAGAKRFSKISLPAGMNHHPACLTCVAPSGRSLPRLPPGSCQAGGRPHCPSAAARASCAPSSRATRPCGAAVDSMCVGQIQMAGHTIGKHDGEVEKHCNSYICSGNDRQPQSHFADSRPEHCLCFVRLRRQQLVYCN
jgi:hypothetical protein